VDIGVNMNKVLKAMKPRRTRYTKQSYKETIVLLLILLAQMYDTLILLITLGMYTTNMSFEICFHDKLSDWKDGVG
jgi:hypothetical protein